MSIILVRHGETPLNAARVLQPPDTPLSERGLEQAAAVARRLAGHRLAGILSSDLPRARMTAEAISSACGLPVAETVLLHERNFGDLRGLPYDSLGFDPIARDEAPPGGESMDVFRERVAAAFAQALRMRASLEGDLAVVTHGLVIKTLLRMHTVLPSGAEHPEHVANTSVTILEADAPYRVTLLNCARHLEGDARDDGRGVSGV
ncbi:MAG: hypothetical protein RIS35_2199 [Pseudomonadota bacterium]